MGVASKSRRRVLRTLGGVAAIGGGIGTVTARQEQVRKKTFVFRKASVEQGAPQTCSETGEWTKFGRGARLPAGRTTYTIRGSAPDSGAIRAAFDTMGSAAGVVNFTQTDDSKNIVRGASLQEDVLAVAEIFFFPTEIVRFRITFNTRVSWGSGSQNTCFTEGAVLDTQGVATHEIGHVCGLGHTNSPKSTAHTMYAFEWPDTRLKRSLAKGDEIGINALYG